MLFSYEIGFIIPFISGIPVISVSSTFGVSDLFLRRKVIGRAEQWLATYFRCQS